MSFDYDAIAGDVTELLAEFGGPLTLRQTRGGTYVDGAMTGTTTTETKGNGVIVDYSLGFLAMAGGLVQAADRRCLLEPGVPQPQPDDEIVQGTQTYVVIRVSTVAPAGTVVLYDLQVR